MRAEPATIELGVLPPHQPEAEPPWPGWARLRRLAGHRATWRAATVTVLLMVTTASAAAPRPPWLVHVFSVPMASDEGWYELTEHALYVSQHHDSGVQLTAYRLADGAASWEVPGASYAYVVGDMPVLVSHDFVDRERPAERTTVLDPATGQARWTGAGSISAATDDLLVLSRELREPDPSDGPWPADEQRPTYALTMVDSETGDEVWSLPAVHAHNFPQDRRGYVTGLVTLDRDGRLTSYDLATGRSLATAPAAASSETGYVSVAGDLVVVQVGHDDPVVTAYDVDTLTHVWSTELAGVIYDLTTCGLVVCVNGEDAPPQAIDPATGELAWSADWFSGDGYFASDPGPPWPPGLLLIHNWVIEAGTGERIMHLDDWSLSFSSVDYPDPILTRHEPRRGQETGRSWFGRLRLDPPSIEVLGSADSGSPNDGGPSGCQLAGRHVACVDRSEIHVSRVRELP